MARHLAALTVALVVFDVGATSVAAQFETSLEGVWAVQDVRFEDSNAGPQVSDPTGFIMFTGEHYSMMYLRSTDRPDMQPLEWNVADAATLLAIWGPLTANAGTFEASSNTVTFRPTVAKNTFPMAQGAFQEFSFTLVGDTLTLVAGASGIGFPPNPWTVQLTRVQ